MKKQLDLGSGASPRQFTVEYEPTGVDIFDYGLPNVKVCDIALESLPFDSDTFDLVTAYDTLEHIPPVVYLPEKVKIDGKQAKFGERNIITGNVVKRQCMIELFNEVYRVLKDGGEFFFALPLAGTTEFYRDPTHVYPWVQQSLHYFSGDYFGHHDDYGHTSKFELKDYKIIDDWRMEATLKAIKPAEPPYVVGPIT